MIVPMKKVLVVVQSKDAEKAVDTLRSLGVMHVDHQQTPTGRDLLQIREEMALIESCLVVVQEAKNFRQGTVSPKQTNTHKQKEWRSMAHHLVDLKCRFDQLQEYSLSLQLLISHWERWGNFNPADIQQLSEAGIFVRLYEIPLKEVDRVPKDVVLRYLARSKGMVLCAVVSRTQTSIPFPAVELPKMSVAEMKTRLKEDAHVLRKIESEIIDFIPALDRFLSIREELKRELEFKEAIHGMGQTAGLSSITGFVPEDQTKLILHHGHLQQWGVMVEDPTPDDTVPTLVKTSAWISLVTPVLRLLGIVPGYTELDISPLFFVSLSVFFGILIGDAGYGLMYLLLTFVLQKRVGNRLSDQTVFYLGYVLSTCAIVWGILTATFFGQQWLTTLGIKPLVPALNNAKFMQTLCFFIGALHLTLAHVWRALLKLPATAALADLGWCGVLWTAFLLAKNLILGDPFPSFGTWLLGLSLALVIFFTNPQKNAVKAAAEGLGTVALSLMNNFTDVVSYIRLFAVGLAGVAIAETTNAMAASLGNGFLGGLGGVLIIIIGHGLNIILGPMSVLVHGVRLNVLEFSGHANVTWSGFPYHPLKK